jgi:DNA-binding NarL/FixJ family response regulator
MKVGIVSRFALMRKMLCGLLSTMDGVEVVLEVGSALENFVLIKMHHPSILLIDTENQVQDLAAVRQLSKLFSEVKILLLVESPNDQFEVCAMQAGARGCISKGTDPEVLEKALNVVERGQFWISREIASMVAGRFAATQLSGQDLSRELTQREWAVLGLLATGYVNKEIAARLVISANTVKVHLASIYRKLGVTTRLGAVLHYFRHAREAGHPSSPASFPLESAKITSPPALDGAENTVTPIAAVQQRSRPLRAAKQSG